MLGRMQGMQQMQVVQRNAARAAVSTLAPRSGERVARAQRGPGEGQRLAVLLPLTRFAPSALATLSPLRGARVRVRHETASTQTNSL
jgi:hypothetical protein